MGGALRAAPEPKILKKCHSVSSFRVPNFKVIGQLQIPEKAFFSLKWLFRTIPGLLRLEMQLGRANRENRAFLTIFCEH